ncbi:MAG TPA: ribbon-helix-helix protein, CopG family [Candidatus Angelobacter sp.]
MRRTQLYLDEDLWNALHAHARREGTTVSDLVRQAARERYLGKLDERRDAMQAFIGVRRDRSDLPGSIAYVRSLRRGRRLAGLAKK